MDRYTERSLIMSENRPFTQLDKDLAAFMYEQGRSSLEIAKLLSRTPSTVRNAIKKSGVSMRPFSIVNARDVFDRNFFASIDSEPKAYWLGFISADGSVGKKYCITISLHPKDMAHLEKFLSCIGSGKSPRKTSGGYARVDISSAEMVRDLAVLGVKNKKTFTLRMPDLEPELTRHYLRGYIDGDGCIAYYPRSQNRNGFNLTLRVTSNNKFALSVGNALSSVCQKEFGISDEGNGISTIYWSQRQAIQRLLHYLYDNSSIFLERKKVVAEKILSLDPV